MARVALRYCAVLTVVCAFFVGCDQPRSPSAADTPDVAANVLSASDSGSPEREPFECDLGVLPEDVHPVRSSAFYAGGVPGSASVAPDLSALVGDRLYVLSQLGQLTVVDSSDLDQLSLLSRYTLPYTPFKLIPRADTLWVITSAARGIEPGQGNLGVSHAIALDVSDPAAIRELTSLDIPGVIDDAQVAGDLLYLVSNEFPACRDCTVPAPPTVVTAIALDDTSATQPRSQLRFGEPAEQWTNVNVMLRTAQRLYVAGPQWGGSGPIGSTVHVVDISAQDGMLRAAAELKVAGAVQYGWQIDERDGVLRVVSIDSAAKIDPLVLQTFAVRASDQFEPLGRLAMPLSLPRDPFQELGGRFDGARAFLAAEGGGTLLVVDLSDPSAPKRVGRVQLDGALSYLEAHDDRLFALGLLDRASSVALLDVSNLAAPALRSQLPFPAAPMLTYVGFPQQALELSADGRLLIIPYYASEFLPRWDCHGHTAGGVQLISVAGDQLSLRGVAGSAGQPRRAILRDDRILSIGNQHVESYALSDPNAPQLRTRLTIQQDVTFVAQLAGGISARVTQPEDNIAPRLELVTDQQAADPSQSLGAFSLPDALTTDPELSCQLQFRVEAVSARDSTLYVAFESFQTLGDETERRVGVLAIDASDPSAPKLAGKVDWVTNEWFELNPYVEPTHLKQATFVWSGSTVVLLERTNAEEQRLRIVDLSDASDPHVELVALPKDRYVQLQVEGDHVLASRYQRQSGARVRFFVDRIDISDPRAPRLLSAVNTPGALLQLDPETGRGLSYCWHHAPRQSNDACPEQESTAHTCLELKETLQLIELNDSGARELDHSELPGDLQLRASARGTGVHFVALSSSDGRATLLALPVDARTIERDRRELDLAPAGLSGALRLYAQAERAFVSSAQNAAWVAFDDGALALEQQFQLETWIAQIDVSARGAALALGARGAQWLAAPE